MGLDTHLRFSVILDVRAKPHPFPDRLSFDETGEPFLTGDPSEDELEAHDRWCAESCEHGGYLLSLPLGNITRVGHLRTFLHGLEGNPGLRFPILLNKVIYDGTHAGDWIASDMAAAVVKEVDTVLHSRDSLASSQMEFIENMQRLCEASVETGNPIMF